ncbi:ion transporter [Skermania piniformis]
MARYPRKPPSRWTDWTMLTLAIVSVALVLWVSLVEVSDRTYRTVLWIDLAICAIFALEFLWRWRQEAWRWTFPLFNWYELVGMVPMIVFPGPEFRTLRLLRIVVVLARLGRAADRAFGERITAMLLRRFVGTVVEVIKRPITIAILDEVGDVLQGGHYTKNIAAALQENHREMDEMILDKIREDPTAGRLRYLPFHDDIIRLVADTVFRILQRVLADPRTDELVADLLRENVDQIRLAVRGRYEDERPDGLGKKDI